MDEAAAVRGYASEPLDVLTKVKLHSCKQQLIMVGKKLEQNTDKWTHSEVQAKKSIWQCIAIIISVTSVSISGFKINKNVVLNGL